MHLKVSEKRFCRYSFCIVYTVASFCHENMRFPDFLTFFLKVIIKSYNKLDNFFLPVGCPGLLHYKNIYFILRKCANFRDIVGKMSFFF